MTNAARKTLDWLTGEIAKKHRERQSLVDQIAAFEEAKWKLEGHIDSEEQQAKKVAQALGVEGQRS